MSTATDATRIAMRNVVDRLFDQTASVDALLVAVMGLSQIANNLNGCNVVLGEIASRVGLGLGIREGVPQMFGTAFLAGGSEGALRIAIVTARLSDDMEGVAAITPLLQDPVLGFTLSFMPTDLIIETLRDDLLPEAWESFDQAVEAIAPDLDAEQIALVDTVILQDLESREG